MFDTYGPFELKTHDDEEIEALFSKINVINPALNSAVGVYIVATDNGSAGLTPWYVGMTTDEFGGRLFKGHFKRRKFAELAAKAPLRIFLIALRDGKQFVHAGDLSDDQELIIEMIEKQLIDRCYLLNNKLLNKKLWSPTQIHVPGFIDKGGSERNFEAAQQLAKMLGT